MPNVSHLLSIAAIAAGLGDDKSLEYALRAQQLLADKTWTEVIRIENTASVSRYPKVVNALIFQLDSALWFYTPTDGTQSLSHFRGRTEADKLNLGPLLASIDPGFTRWETAADYLVPPSETSRLPNGCFLESMAILFRRLSVGGKIEDPRLLSYYVVRPEGIRGHSVLQYKSEGRIMLIDPDRPARVISIHYANAEDPKSVIGRIRNDVAKARYLPLGEFLDREPKGYSAIVSRSSTGS